MSKFLDTKLGVSHALLVIQIVFSIMLKKILTSRSTINIYTKDKLNKKNISSFF